MLISEQLRREWRQFRLLSHDAVRKLVNTAVLSRDSDPAQFALWTIVAVTTPAWMYAFKQTFKYTALRSATPPEVIEAALGDRMFFIVYGMIATALVVALLWDALFPTLEDQEVVGPLPVRPRTVAAARLMAATAVVLTFAAAVCTPAAVIFAGVTASHSLLGFFPTVLGSHLAATMGGCLFVFASLLVVRVAVAVAFGARASERLATALQIITVIGLVGAFLYLPTVIPWLVKLQYGADWARFMPPIWFGSLYAWMAGPETVALGGYASRAIVVLGVVSLGLVPLYLIPACMLTRRALASRPQSQTGVLSATVGIVTRVAHVSPPTGALLVFTFRSLARNRRHLLIAVTYAGLGVAIGLTRLVSVNLRGLWTPDRADAALLTLPLVLMLTVIVGLRNTFKLPAELDANWLFRLSPPNVRQTVAATRLALVLLAVCPSVIVFGATAAFVGWPLDTVLVAMLFDVALGLLLAQWAVHEWTRVPFACAHAPDPSTVRTRWLAFVGVLFAFAFIGANVQEAALSSTRGSLVYLSVVSAGTAALHLWHARQVRRVSVEFDEEAEGTPAILGLSEALR